MITEFKPLRIGDIRKRGDQVRQKWVPEVGLKPNDSTQPPNFGEWKEVELLNWPILTPDLFNAEFRRPLI